MHTVDLADERWVNAVAEHAANVLGNHAHGVATDRQGEGFLRERSQGSQYWAVTANRGYAERFAPPPCHRVDRKNTHDPGPHALLAHARQGRVVGHPIGGCRG